MNSSGTRSRPARSAPLVLSLLLVVGVAAPALRAQTGPDLFRNGDRWCAMGDSITHSGSYHEWVNLFYLTRFPERRIDALNCGIGGDTASGGLGRLDWDVFPKQPTVTSIMFGMNDIGRSLYGEESSGPAVERQRRERIDLYKENMRELVGRLQARGSRVILLTPSIFDQTASGDTPRQTGANEALGECAAFAGQLAAESGSAIVDFYGPMNRINRERQARNPAFTVVGPDRVHPGPAGHLLMAYLFLKAQQAPGLVSRLVLDLRTNQVTAADNGAAENVRKDPDGGVTFIWTPRALPFPVAPEAAAALEWVPFTAELNQEILQVTGLRSGRYELRIDDYVVRSFTAAELAGGVNLASETTTPQYQQAADVLRLLGARTELVADNLRRIAQVEHQLAPGLPRPLTLEQMRPLIGERLESGDRPLNDRMRRILEEYPQRKEREGEAIGSADRLARLAWLTAQPRPHLYAIRPVR